MASNAAVGSRAMGWWRRERQAGQPGAIAPRSEWTKCAGCKEILPGTDLVQGHGVCPRCGHHHPIGARERLELLVDGGSFAPFDAAAGRRDLLRGDPLGFRDRRRYRERLRSAKKRSGLDEALLVASGHLDGRRVIVGVLAGEFLAGSVGGIVGERLALAFGKAIEARAPLLLWSSSGGLRLQEGVLSLLALVRIAHARAALAQAGVPYFSVLSGESSGLDEAGFLLTADVNLAEPGALIAPVEQEPGEPVPRSPLTAEALLARGLVDAIVPRHELRARLSLLVRALASRIPPA